MKKGCVFIASIKCSQRPFSLDEDQVKNPTVKRQQTLEDKGYKY